MFAKLLWHVFIISACVGDVSEDEYVDAVLDMLLNGVSREFEQSNEDDDGKYFSDYYDSSIWRDRG